LSEAADDQDGVSAAIISQLSESVLRGRFADSEALYAEFRQRKHPGVAHYRPGAAEFWSCLNEFYQGRLSEAEWQSGYDVAVRHRSIIIQYGFLALSAQWELINGTPARALAAIEQALQITKKLGTPRHNYHDLRAWALAGLGRTADAREGPPYIDWYALEHSRAVLKQLGQPEPQLPPFDPSKVPPIPFEKEIRAAIERLTAERAEAKKRPAQ
jgi:hypothetical protein